MDRMRKALKEAQKDFKNIGLKPDRNPGPTVRELRHIHNEMQEILEISAYGASRNINFPKTQENKADLKTFLLLKGKFQRSKKYRYKNHVMDGDHDDDEQNKVLQDQEIQVDEIESGLVKVKLPNHLVNLMWNLLDEQNYCPERNIMDASKQSWSTLPVGPKLFIPHAIFESLFKYNLGSDQWECFPREATQQNKDMLEMIRKNPSKYLWSAEDKDKLLGYYKMHGRERDFKEEEDNLYDKIETICLLAEARTEFEKHLVSYIETRIAFEEKLDQIVNTLNLLTLLEYKPEDVDPKVKGKLKDLLESGMSFALQVGKYFNIMTNHSLTIVPDIPGNYNWFNFRRGKEVIRRYPWHQYVDIREAQDISVKVNQLREADIKDAEIGVEINVADLDETLRLMKPEDKYDKKGRRKYFMDLWKKQTEEEVSLKVNKKGSSFND